VSTWSTRAVTSDSPPPMLWAAKYEAVVTSDIESASLTLNDAVPAADLQRILSIPPEWTVDSWPPSSTDPQTLALAKIKALLDFDAQLPSGGSGGNDSAGIRAHLSAAFPGVGAGRAKGAKNAKVFGIKAVVRLEDGQAEWEVAVPAAGEFPTGITSEDLDPGAPLKVFLQNIARADVLKRMGR
jgi:hypothetical protein